MPTTTMKIIHLALLSSAGAASAAVESASSSSRLRPRQLEDGNGNYNNANGENANNANDANYYGEANGQNYNYNNGQNGQNNNYYNNGQNYEDFEAYMESQMAARSFSFAGCATPTGQTGQYNRPTTYVTFRLCDQCTSRSTSSRSKNADGSWVDAASQAASSVSSTVSSLNNGGSKAGCGTSNGEFVVTMQNFAEYYGDYLQEVYGRDMNPYECVRVEEFIENMQDMYQYGGNYWAQAQDQAEEQERNGNNNWYNNYQYQNQQGNGGEEVEFYIGPHCGSGSGDIEYAVFYDEECSYRADSISVEQVLAGYTPDNALLKPQECIRCGLNGGGQNQNYYNYDNQQQQQEDVELLSLCDAMLEVTQRCDRGEEMSEFDKFWQDVVRAVNGGNGDDEAQAQGQQQYGYSNNYYSPNNENICAFIDSIAPGAWATVKGKAKGISQGAIIAMIVLIPIALAIPLMFLGYCCGRVASACPSRSPSQIKKPLKPSSEGIDDDYYRYHREEILKEVSAKVRAGRASRSSLADPPKSSRTNATVESVPASPAQSSRDVMEQHRRRASADKNDREDAPDTPQSSRSAGSAGSDNSKEALL